MAPVPQDSYPLTGIAALLKNSISNAKEKGDPIIINGYGNDGGINEGNGNGNIEAA